MVALQKHGNHALESYNGQSLALMEMYLNVERNIKGKKTRPGRALAF
jgi:hypothetical protein